MKRKGDTKAGKVVRLNPQIWKLVDSRRRSQETNSRVIERLIGQSVSGEVAFVLPSQLHRTLEDAWGAAVLLSVRVKGKPPGVLEEPVAVLRREVE